MRRSPDGTHIAYLDDAYQLWVERINGSDVVGLPNPKPTHVGSFDWSPDSQRLVYSQWGTDSDGIWSIGVKGRGKQLVVRFPFAVDYGVPVRWSPKGDLIAYLLGPSEATNTRDPRDGIYVVRPNGSGNHVIQHNRAAYPLAGGLSWSYDSRSLLYTTLPPRRGLWRLDVKSRRGTRLAAPYYGAFSPRTRDILFLDGVFRLWVIRPNGRRVKLANGEDGIYSAAWSPNGHQIAFTHDGLWVVDVATLRTRRVFRWKLPPGQIRGRPLLWGSSYPEP